MYCAWRTDGAWRIYCLYLQGFVCPVNSTVPGEGKEMEILTAPPDWILICYHWYKVVSVNYIKLLWSVEYIDSLMLLIRGNMISERKSSLWQNKLTSMEHVLICYQRSKRSLLVNGHEPLKGYYILPVEHCNSVPPLASVHQFRTLASRVCY